MCGSGVAVFNQGLFLARYPEFGAVNSGKLLAYFEEAGLYLSNCPTSPVQNVNKRLLLLNMLVAHISFLAGDLNSPGSNPLPPSTQLLVQSTTSGPFAVAHGLPVAPTSIEILMTSAGNIWAQTPAFDANYVYLNASAGSLTATVSLFLAGQAGSAAGARPAGRTSQATEGSVSAAMDYPAPQSAAWFIQSEYGANFWQATAYLRSATYMPQPTNINPRGRFGFRFR